MTWGQHRESDISIHTSALDDYRASATRYSLTTRYIKQACREPGLFTDSYKTGAAYVGWRTKFDVVWSVSVGKVTWYARFG